MNFADIFLIIQHLHRSNSWNRCVISFFQIEEINYTLFNNPYDANPFIAVTNPTANPSEPSYYNQSAPPPLAPVNQVRAFIANQICAYAAENNYDISLMFDPYNLGVDFVTASFNATTMNGCDDLTQPFGFNSDFTVTFTTGGPVVVSCQPDN